MRKLIFIGVASLTLSACAHTAAGGLYVSELAYNGYGSSVVAANQSGILKGDKLQKAKDIDNQAYAALLLARQGKASADAVNAALGQANGLVPLPSATPAASAALAQ